jgi:hypothetical protein
VICIVVIFHYFIPLYFLHSNIFLPENDKDPRFSCHGGLSGGTNQSFP